MASKKVRVGKHYKFTPNFFDSILYEVALKEGEEVKVVNKQGCPPANTMGMCYVERMDGTFAGMVMTNALEDL